MELAQHLLLCIRDSIKVDFHRIEDNRFILRLTYEGPDERIHSMEQTFSYTSISLMEAPEHFIGRELRRCYLALKGKVSNV